MLGLVTSRHIISGLRIGNTLPKKQILEMVAALCAHSLLGYKCVMAGLDHVKVRILFYLLLAVEVYLLLYLHA